MSCFPTGLFSAALNYLMGEEGAAQPRPRVVADPAQVMTPAAAPLAPPFSDNNNNNSPANSPQMRKRARHS